MTTSALSPSSLDDTLKTVAKSLARVVADWDRSGTPRKDLYYRIRSAKHLLCDVSDVEDQVLPERAPRLRN